MAQFEVQGLPNYLSFGGVLFFFSSRRRHTRLVSDWSSDVCSSDLFVARGGGFRHGRKLVGLARLLAGAAERAAQRRLDGLRNRCEIGDAVERRENRSEERRVGKEGRSRGSAEQ